MQKKNNRIGDGGQMASVVAFSLLVWAYKNHYYKQSNSTPKDSPK